MANRKNKQKRFYTLLVQVILVFMAVLALFPFLWIILFPEGFRGGICLSAETDTGNLPLG